MDSAPKAEKIRQIYEELNALNVTAGETKDLVSDLFQRLIPIHHPVADRPQREETKQEGSELVPLAFDIQKIRIFLVDLNADIRDLLSALEI